MPLSLTAFSDGVVIPATGATSPLARITSVQDYINYGIGTADIGTDWVDHKRIFKPDFYGSPAPKTRFESSVVHYDYVEQDRTQRLSFHADKIALDPNDGSTGWQWVPSLTRTIHVPSKSNGTTGSNVCRAHVAARCFVYEQGGDRDLIGAPGVPGDPGDIENTDAVAFQMALYVNSSRQEGTIRVGFCGGDGDQVGPYQFSRKEMSWSVQLADMLSAGQHTVGVKIRVYPMTFDVAVPLRHKHIWIDGRNFELDMWLK